MTKSAPILWLSCLILPIDEVNTAPYKAAVMEYLPKGSVSSQTPAQVLGANLDQDGGLIEQAAGLEAADTVVFPVYGLTTLSLSSLSRVRARQFLQQFPAIIVIHGHPWQYGVTISKGSMMNNSSSLD